VSRFARLIVFAIVAILACTFAACAALKDAAKLLPTIDTAVSDAALILDQIDRYVGVYFAARPNPALEKKVVDALAKARAALIIAERVAAGGAALDQKKTNEAFADFADAFKELKSLVDSLGTEPVPVGHELPPAPAKPDIPDPLALQLKGQ
jgi:hypothetical protein